MAADLKVYDGPASLFNASFVNIREESLGAPSACPPAPGVGPGVIFNTPWCTTKGLPGKNNGQECFLTHAAIGWKVVLSADASLSSPRCAATQRL